MTVLVLNIVLVTSTIIISIFINFYQTKNKQVPRSLLKFSTILLLITIVFTPYTILNDYFEKGELKKENEIIKAKQDSTVTILNKEFSKIRSLEIRIRLLLYPTEKPNFADYAIFGERMIFLQDSLKKRYSFLDSYQNYIPKIGEKHEIFDTYLANSDTKLLGENLDLLNKIEFLVIPLNDYIQLPIKDTIGVNFSILVNGLHVFQTDANKTGNKIYYIKKYIGESTDTLYYRTNDIFKNLNSKLIYRSITRK